MTTTDLKQEVEALVRLHLEIDIEEDAATAIISELQVFSEYLLSPVEIIDLKEETDIYGNREEIVSLSLDAIALKAQAKDALKIIDGEDSDDAINAGRAICEAILSQ